ncbi:crossover junction endodeoxyribonuclease RuvC [Moraxella sp. ZY200743]|uniref:crossover junction endodeoxyribonuclease RuvC n=1 Tax=Moraxella sp. ZY200743 TaxID=2911970 RepID=UPI003D7DCF8F
MSENLETVIGFDPSLRNWGYCIASFNPETKTLFIKEGGVINSNPKTQPYQNLEDLASATQLYDGLYKLNQTHKPKYFIAELPVGSQSARAMVSYGVCIALSSVVAYQDGVNTIPLLAVTPQEVKRTVGQLDASKEQVINWVVNTYPEVCAWLNKYPKGKQEHICDAIAATHTALLN